jgi:hypothetical protein
MFEFTANGDVVLEGTVVGRISSDGEYDGVREEEVRRDLVDQVITTDDEINLSDRWSLGQLHFAASTAARLMRGFK